MSTVNSSYTYELTVATEQSLGSSITNAFSSAQSLAAVFRQKGRMADLRQESGANLVPGMDLTGDRVNVPVWMTAGVASGMTRTNMFNTGITPDFVDLNDIGPASYKTAVYYSVVAMDVVETKLLAGADITRGYNILQGKVQREVDSTWDAVEADLRSSTVEAGDKVMGIPYILGTSNTVGGISQSTFSNWQANVLAINGAISAAVLRKGINATRRERVSDGTERADIIVATENSSAYLYSAIEALGDATFSNFVNIHDSGKPGDVQRVGAQWTVWGGCMVVRLPIATTTSQQLWFLNSGALWFLGGTGPEMFGTPTLNPSKGRYETTLAYPVNFGTTNPGRHAKLTGVTG